MNLDSQILQYFNSLACKNEFWFNLFNVCGNIEIIRAGPVFACFIYVSFSNFSVNAKSKILLGLFGACICLIISVYCQSHWHLHLRPVFDGSLNICNLLKWDKSNWGNRLYSFPSDTATIYFAMSSIIFLQNRKLGLFSFLWIAFSVGMSRVALGIHYPSDIVGGLILGFTVIFAFSQIKIAKKKIEGLLIKYDPKFNLFNILIVVFCAEAYSLFPSILKILGFVMHRKFN